MWIEINGALINLNNVQVVWVPGEDDAKYDPTGLIIGYVTNDERRFNFSSHEAALKVLNIIRTIVNPKILR
jgi:hypothetical protein